jgi:hypothetical protein
MAESLEARRLLAFSAFVNFQPTGTGVPSGYKADTGDVFGNRGGGLSYGWNAVNNNAIDRNSSKSADQRFDTFAQMQENGNFFWEIGVPVGTYNVRVFAGDPTSADAFYHLVGETKTLINGQPSSPNQLWIGANTPVNVTDGRLTISNGANARNNKINFIEVTKAAPTPASGLTATAQSATQISLNWTDNAINEDSYVVERQTGSSNVWQAVATLGANATSYADSGLSPGTRYAYQIRAQNDVGSSYPSIAAVATTPNIPSLAPAAPSNLTSSVNGNVITLSWTDNSNNEDKFLIQTIGYTGGFETVKEVAANQTSGTAYLRSASVMQFRVVARNAAGGNSDASNVLSVATKPEAPVYVNAQPVSSSAIDVSWDSLDSCQFHVEKLVSGEWVRIASDLLSLSYRDANLPAGTPQSYRVLAVAANEAGDSAPSDVVTASTAPRAVTGLSVTARTSSSISLRWDDAAGEAGYLIERSLDALNWTTVTLTYANVTTFTNTGLASATTYRYRVTGFANGVILGDRGGSISGTTLGGGHSTLQAGHRDRLDEILLSGEE